jgi:hypothetical protein
LADGDQLSVSSLEEGYTLVSFTKTDGTRLDLKVQDSDGNSIGIHFTDSTGKEFAFYSEKDFVIPGLVSTLNDGLMASPSPLTPTREAQEKGDYRGSWATYMRKDENNGLGSLSIPSLRLNLNLNKIHGDFVKKTEVKTTEIDTNGLCIPPEPPKKIDEAELKRIAEEEKKAKEEAAKKAEEEKKAAEEAKKKEEEKKKAEEAAKKEDEKR